MAVKTNEKPRVVLHFQHFDKGYPMNPPKSWEVSAGMTSEKAFDYAVARFKEEVFHKKQEIHRHD